MVDTKKVSGKKSIYYYVAVVLAVLSLGLFLWKMVAVSSIRSEMRAEQQASAEQCQKKLNVNTHALLRLTTIPLVWSIRQEMLRDNHDQINEYIVSLVKQPGIKQIIVAKRDGTIAFASDRKMEGQAIGAFLSPEDVNKGEIALSDQPTGDIRVVAPIMGLNARIGMIMVVYSPSNSVLE